MAGFSQGGGVGLALSNWMVNGDPGFDVWGMDVARFGEWASLRYTNAKVRENYSRRFSIRFPNEELPAARPAQTTPLYDTMVAQNAVMGDSWGLETPLWFAPKGTEPKDVVSFHRSNDFEHVGNEVRRTRESVGVTEIANFAKYEVSGTGSEAFLNRLMTNRMPKPGRIVLTPMLNEFGKLIGDFTIANAGRPGAAEDRFIIWGSSAAQKYHMRWFEKHLPRDGSVRIHRFDQTLVGLSIAGPNSQKLLQKLVDVDVSSKAFRFMDFREMAVGGAPAWSTASPTPAISVTRSGCSPPTSASSTRRSRMRARNSASSISACAHCSPCGSRRISRHGSANCDRSTARSRVRWIASSSSRRMTSSAVRPRPASMRTERSCAASP